MWVLRFLDCAAAPPAPAAARPSFCQVLLAGGMAAHVHQVSAIGLHRCVCIPMRMSVRKGLSYGQLPNRSTKTTCKLLLRLCMRSAQTLKFPLLMSLFVIAGIACVHT